MIKSINWKSIDQNSMINYELIDYFRIKKLEVDPLCQKTVDLNICQKNVSTAKMRSTDLRNLKEKENSEGFVDDDNVPPLESF